MDHKVFAGGRPEEEVEEASCQPQGLAAVFGKQDEAVGRNRAPDPEHRTLQCLILRDAMLDKTFKQLKFYLSLEKLILNLCEETNWFHKGNSGKCSVYKVTVYADTSPSFADLFHSSTRTYLNMLT